MEDIFLDQRTLAGQSKESLGQSKPWIGFPSILNCPASAHLFSSTAKVIHSALKRDVVVGLLAAQLCLTLCNPLDCSLAGSSVHGILQTRILEWVTILLQWIFLTQGWNLGLLHCHKETES